MTDKARGTPLFNHLLLILMGVVLVYLVVSFARQVSVSHQRSEELHRIEEDIALARDEYARLQEHLAFVRSMEALEKWGRQQGLIRSGEVLVVPVGGQAQLPPAVKGATEAGKVPESPREAWWDLFFRPR
jgi:hypothetical protein